MVSPWSGRLTSGAPAGASPKVPAGTAAGESVAAAAGTSAGASAGAPARASAGAPAGVPGGGEAGGRPDLPGGRGPRDGPGSQRRRTGRAAARAGARDFVPLRCLSSFSFLEGASMPEELVEAAEDAGYRAIGLADRDGMYGMVRAHAEARNRSLRLICGSTLTLAEGGFLLILAEDRDGYGNLCELISAGRLRNPKGSSSVRASEVAERAAGLIAVFLPDGGYPPGEACELLRDAFAGAAYVGIARHLLPEDRQLELAGRGLARKLGLPLVAVPEVRYHARERKPLRDVLTCIRYRTSIDEAGALLDRNDEFALPQAEELAKRYRDDPRLLERTAEIAERAHFTLGEISYRYPEEHVPAGYTTSGWLARLCRRGARSRYPEGVPEDVRDQLKRELAVIEELEYAGYFLTMHEIVRFCEEQGILCQGRGSAANSIVCYCLGITAIDPVRMNLLFERFLSKERAEPPDIDLDIEHERREEVIRHMYERYGARHAAMVANVITYRPRSAVREVGAVLGFPESTLDRLARLVGRHADSLDETMRAEGLSPDSGRGALLARFVREILGMPRHLSIHPGGFLLGNQPVDRLVPMENATMPGRVVVQWDKDDIEEMGLFKVDLLGLGALSQLRRCFELLRSHHGIRLSMAEIPSGDRDVYRMLSRGDTVGVFQLESRAQMAMLPRMKPRTFHDIVIEISIVRPGPITGGMVHPYLRRRSGEEPVRYPHPSLEPILRKTLGVPLFQEQVMKLAVEAADYTPGEADRLRRDMAAWRKTGRIEQHRDRMIERMTARGISRRFAEQVFEQIRGFGEYGFPESHAASFALIAYATAYIRRHHPEVFTCALLNAWPMGFYAPSTIVEDARRHGITVRPADVSYSDWFCTLEVGTSAGGAGGGGGARVTRHSADGTGTSVRAPNPSRADHASPAVGRRPAVRMGLRFVKGVGEGDWERICEARPFKSGEDFIERSDLAEDVLVALAEGGVLASLGIDRRQALWKSYGIRGSRENRRSQNGHGQGRGSRSPASRKSAGGTGGGPDGGAPSGAGGKTVRGLDGGAPSGAGGETARGPDGGALSGAGGATARGLDGGSGGGEPGRGAGGTGGEDKSGKWTMDSSGLLAGIGSAPEPRFDSLSSMERIAWDYGATGHSVRGHPLETARSELARMGLPDAAAVAGRPEGVRVRYAGLVICRQRPETAGGTLFITLEDESGFVNAIVKREVFERFRSVVLTSAFLGVTGILQKHPTSPYVLAESLWRPEVSFATAAPASRDFQ